MLNPDVDRLNFHRSVILQPIVTESRCTMPRENTKYHFRVHSEANKIQIREAVEKLFGCTFARLTR